jgi:hypothetical protein
MHDATCSRHRRYCEDCEQVITKSEWENHQQQYHTQIECECGEQVLQAHLAQHKRNECGNRLVPCMYCECPLFIYELPDHEQLCGVRTDLCELCGERNTVAALVGGFHTCGQQLRSTPDSGDTPRLSKDSRYDGTLPSQATEECPFCQVPILDYIALQEHIFNEHPEILI